jgi:RNA polymerase sigma-70 factor (ECF subfamily)
MTRTAPLLEKLDSDCTTAFWQRWQLHQQALLRLAHRFLREHPSDAEDAVTATLLRALQRLPAAHVSITNERAWLIRVLYNICMDMHRTHKRFVEPAPSDTHETLDDKPDAVLMEIVAPPEEALLKQEQSARLRTHIQALPSQLRSPLVMRFYLDMSYPEIASELNLTNCNVRKRIQLAYAKLRAEMGSSELRPEGARP